MARSFADIVRAFRRPAAPRPGPPAAPPAEAAPRIPAEASLPLAAAGLQALLGAPRLVDGEGLHRGERGDWVLRATLLRACGRLRIDLDRSAPLSTGAATGWRPHERLTVATRTGLKAGEVLDVPLLVEGSGEGAGRWSWVEEGAVAREPVPATQGSRCRLVFARDGRPEQTLYFVLLSIAPSGEPVLVDETLFRFRDAWEAEAPLAQPPRWRGF